MQVQTLILLCKLFSVLFYFWFLKKTLPKYPFSSHGKRSIEPLFKCAAALENGWKKEIEQSPKFRQFVLQRSPSQQDSPRGHVVSVQDLGQLAVMVLHAVALIYYHVLPPNLEGKEKLEQARLCQVPPRTKIIKAWDTHLSQPWGNQGLFNYQCPC